MQNQGTLQERYDIYVSIANDGKGNDILTGEPLKSFDEWLNSWTFLNSSWRLWLDLTQPFGHPSGGFFFDY